MIYICGTGLSQQDLPLSSDLQYSIENAPTKIKSILLMGISKPSVTKAYIKQEFEGLGCTPTAKSKVVYFEDDDALLALLKPQSGSDGESLEQPEEPIEEAVETATMLDTTDSDIEEIQQKIDEQDDLREAAGETSVEENSDEFEEADEGITAPIMATGEGLSEVDLMRTKVATLEGVVQQSRDCLSKVNKERDEVYDYAMEQMDKQASEYEAKLKEAQEVIAELKSRLETSESVTGPLSAFEPYADKCRAIVKASLQGITPDPDIIAVSAGSAETTSTLYQSLSMLALSGAKLTILDFTGDPVFGITLTNMAVKIRNVQLLASGQQRQLTSEEYAACSLDSTKDLVKVIRGQCELNEVYNTNLGSARVACAGYYHDLALLTFDWSGFLTKLQTAKDGAKVVLLLPPITSFVGRYLASYLSSAVSCNIAAICAPSSLYSVQTNCTAIPAKRIKLLALNYLKIPATDALLSGVLNEKYVIRMFKANNFLADPEATVKTLEANMKNNNNIWMEAFNPSK